MSDSKKPPKPPPPDDFSKTTPNINIPREDFDDGWDDAAAYKHPAQPSNEDWGNTVNFNTNDDPNFGNTFQPSSQPKASDDWGITQANIDFSAGDFGNKPEDYSDGPENAEMTTPLIKLPDDIRRQYDIPPTPAQKAEQKKEEEKKEGGIPGWFWVTAGLMTMFFLTVLILFGAYMLFIRQTGFELVVKNAPPGSDVYIDGVSWGTTTEKGEKKLTNLKAGTRKIDVKHPTQVCEPREIAGENGDEKEIFARCEPAKVQAGEDCSTINPGEEDKAERCANQALDALSDPPDLDALLAALNKFVINFESNKYDIPPVRMAFLKRAAEFIGKLPPSVVIEVGGHTDSDGTDANNQTLSDNRAKAVKDALVGFGVKAEMLTEKGYGESAPKIANEKNAADKFQNRRIEYKAVKR